MSDPPKRVGRLVEHLFRHEAGRIVAVLTRRLGVEHVELVEDVVQEALLAALRSWPRSGVPSNPAGWLLQVARNRAIDRLRREKNLRGKLKRLRSIAPTAASPANLDVAVDDQLAMMLMCCHPSLSRESQVALTLRTVSGFSVAEIARALLAGEAAVTKRITRARMADLVATAQASYPQVPTVFAGNRACAEEWTWHFLAAALAHARAERSSFPGT